MNAEQAGVMVRVVVSRCARNPMMPGIVNTMTKGRFSIAEYEFML